ncbi:Ribonuclease [Thalassoglobus neptunius]|uniref:Ribonuclease n=1 Tax=Thalassoglobus neptunius TaxID=1938619 RepID=A0A5C5X2Q5_9PLAN|nr:MBL fold metallo-hydrolase [Thalassoglobus neptunius]TWT57130.1 Ribonuclease [Thalassoglobus neptunius]
MKLTFLGAAGEVTGSQHLIETTHRRILLDCGFFQGRRAESRQKNETFYCQPKDLDAVILSHAHIDHCGNLPQLYRKGFRGPVFCTDATADIAEIMLMDSAKIQREDAKYLTRKLKKGHPPVEPFYTEEDVKELIRNFEPCLFSQWYDLTDDGEVQLRFHPSGHVLGSAITELLVKDGTEHRKVVFTGDLGRRDMPLLKDPVPVEGADVLICESTYGNRIHPPAQDIKTELKRIIGEAHLQGGRVIIPAFSFGRTQQIVYYLNELTNNKELDCLPMFLDSPLASRLTQVFRRYDHTLDADVQDTLRFDDDPFGFECLTEIENQQQSIELNDRRGCFVVISASGMCENGRVVHHLKQALPHPQNHVILMGYQAPHTTGRHIAERRKYVRIFDRDVALNAKVEQLEGLSAHADVVDFKWWFEESTKRGHFGKVFLVHGEPDSAKALAQTIRDYCDEDPIIPHFRETFDIP